MKLYLETTIPNFLFADDAPDEKQITEVFFEWLKISPHELFVSPLVEQELSAAPEPKRAKMRRVLRSLPLTDLVISNEAEGLAEAYVIGGAIPRRFEDDALHVALAVCHHLDVVVTWNMRHLAKPSKVARINAINAQRGYPLIRVETPKQVMGL
jgi:hypothetical protein